MARVTFRLDLSAAPGVYLPAPIAGTQLPVHGTLCDVLEVVHEGGGYATVVVEAPDGFDVGHLAALGSMSVLLNTEDRTPKTMTRPCDKCGGPVTFPLDELPKFGVRGAERFIHEVCPDEVTLPVQYVRIEVQVRRGSGSFADVEDAARRVAEFFMPPTAVATVSEGHKLLVELADALDALGDRIAMAAADGRGSTAAAALAAADTDLATAWSRVVNSIAFVDRVPDRPVTVAVEGPVWVRRPEDGPFGPVWLDRTGDSHTFECLDPGAFGEQGADCEDPSFPPRQTRTLGAWLTLTGVRLIDAAGFQDAISGQVDIGRAWSWGEFLDGLTRSNTLTLPEWVAVRVPQSTSPTS